MYKVISTSHSSEVTSADFKAMGKLQMSAFVYIHSFVMEAIPRGQAKKILSNKGKVEESVRGVNNLLLAAYNLRNSPVVLPIPEEDEAESSSPSLDNTPVIVMPSLIHEPIIGVSGKSPADYLSDKKWLALIKANMKGDINVEMTEVSIATK